MPRTASICLVCGETRDYICERCLRCEICCATQDRKRALPEQHGGKWIWSVYSAKGVQLLSLLIAGNGKGDFEGLKARGDRIAGEP